MQVAWCGPWAIKMTDTKTSGHPLVGSEKAGALKTKDAVADAATDRNDNEGNALIALPILIMIYCLPVD